MGPLSIIKVAENFTAVCFWHRMCLKVNVQKNLEKDPRWILIKWSDVSMGLASSKALKDSPIS